MLSRVALVRTDVSEEFRTSIIGVTRISEERLLLVTVNDVPSSPIIVTLMVEVLSSSETPHGVTSQKTPFFIGTTLAVTSNRRRVRRNTKRERKPVCNNRLRMQRGVGVAGSGVSL
jgi:hypothetical protein